MHWVLGKLSRALAKGSQGLQIFWMEASERASEDIHQEQPADEADTDFQKEQVSLSAALQEAKQSLDGREFCMPGDPLKNIGRNR